MRLVHQLSLLLIATVLLSVAAVAGVVAWNLRAGFSDYLRAQDGELLTRLMEVAEQDMAQRGGPPERWRPALGRWLNNSRPEGRRGEEGPGEPGGPFEGSPPPPPPPGDFGGPPRGEGPPPDGPPPDGPPRDGPGRQDPANFGRRVSLLSTDGVTVLVGPRRAPDRPVQVRALKYQGRTVAYLRLVERGGPVQGVDERFLRRQYLGLAAVAAGVVAVSLLLARLFAVRWSQPLRRVQAATRRIADGEFSRRLPAPGGATEIDELHQDINTMAEGLERLEGSRKRWIAELSHELRTPLAVLRGEVEALMDGIRPLDRNALYSLQAEVARLSRLVEDFHALAVSELRSLPCDFAPLAPAAMIEVAVARISGRAELLGLKLTTEMPAVLPAARWDGGRISQLLGNLLENSLRYTTAPGQIRLSARAVEAGIEIRVDDSPPGVSAADMERLFDPLFRADASRSRELGGAGLGLAIARAIAQSHGGSLRALPSPLGGLSLILTLPLRPA